MHKTCSVGMRDPRYNTACCLFLNVPAGSTIVGLCASRKITGTDIFPISSKTFPAREMRRLFFPVPRGYSTSDSSANATRAPVCGPSSPTYSQITKPRTPHTRLETLFRTYGFSPCSFVLLGQIRLLRQLKRGEVF